MKILIYFTAVLTISNAGLLNSLQGRSVGGSGGYYAGGGSGPAHTETIRVIQDHGGYAPQYASHALGGSQGVGDAHIDTIRIIQEHGGGPAYNGHVETVRVIQEVGPIGGHAVGPGDSAGHVETIRVIQDNGGHIPQDISPAIGVLGQVYGGGPAFQTIRIIQENSYSGGGPAIGGGIHSVVNHFNGEPVETIRLIQDNQLRSGPIGGGHHVGNHVQTIRVIKEENHQNFGGGGVVGHISGNDDHIGTIRVINEHSVGHSNGYHYSHPEEHSKLVQIIAAAAGGETHRH